MLISSKFQVASYKLSASPYNFELATWNLSLLLKSLLRQSVSQREARGEFGAVRDDDEDGLLRAVEFEQERGHVVGRLLVEVARRLVAEQERRAPHQRTRQRRALLLAARKFGRAVVHALGEPDRFEQRARPLAVLFAVAARDERRRQHVL